MSKDPTYETHSGHPHQQAIEEHLHLHQLFEDLANSLTASQRTTQVAFVGGLSQLKSELLAHFDHEEMSGYFTDAIEVAPRLKSRADKLLEEHPQLAKTLDRLLGIAESGDPTDSWWKSMTEAFAQFHEEFDEHERGETELIQEAYNRDVGTDD